MVDSGRSTEATMVTTPTQTLRMLFVCSGNDARSLLAEAFASAYLSQNGHGIRWEVGSAGTDVSEGRAVRPEVARVASGFGFDLSGCRARPLTPEICGESDLILTMSWDEVSRIWSLVPEAWDRSFTLKEFVHYAKQAPSTPPIMFPDRTAQIRDKIRQAQAIRKRARSDLGFWGGLRPQDLDLAEPDGHGEGAWTPVAQAIRALVTDSIRLAGGP